MIHLKPYIYIFLISFSYKLGSYWHLLFSFELTFYRSNSNNEKRSYFYIFCSSLLIDISYYSADDNGIPVCTSGGEELQCPCKDNFGGEFCDECAEGYFNFPECTRKWITVILENQTILEYLFS